MTQPQGEVFDLGYQRYDGPREGRMRARKALWTNGIRTALGISRGARSKIMPILFFGAVMTPAVIVILMASVLGLTEDLWGRGEYFAWIILPIILFSAIIAPELLCPDRRDRVLHLYLVRPLTTDDYVIGRWLAFFTISLILVYAGQLVLFLGFTLAADEPFQYLQDNWLDVPRFMAVGFLIAAFTTTIPLAVASFTPRKAYAAGFVIALFVVSSAAAAILTECDDENWDGGEPSGECEPLTGENAKWFDLINVGFVPIAVGDLIFDEKDKSPLDVRLYDTRGGEWIVVSWYLFLVLGPALLLLYKYRRVEI
jgi:ABC-2 type transport system permease protein